LGTYRVLWQPRLLLFERDALWDESLRDPSLWLCVLLSSGVAFFLNVSNFLVTLHTSPVTLQVLGNVKVVLLIAVSVAIFRNEVSPQSVVGCAACLVGVALYNHARRSSPPLPPPKSTAAAEGAVWV